MDKQKMDKNGFALMFGLLLLFWLLISGSFDWQHMLIGVILSFLLSLLWNKIAIEEGSAHTSFTLRQLGQAIYYFLYLLLDILKANVKVAMIVLHPKLPISPGLVIMKNELKNDLPKAVFANSITLTPGTITVDLEGDLIIVHAFTKQTAVDLQEWFLYDLMQKIEAGEEA